MKITEFIKHQAVSLTELLTQFGDIPVVAWNFEGRYLGEAVPLQAIVSYETYTSQGAMSFTDDKSGHVCIMGEIPNPLDHSRKEAMIVEQQRLIERQQYERQEMFRVILSMDYFLRTYKDNTETSVMEKIRMAKLVKDCMDTHTNTESVRIETDETGSDK
jgi:hypothetical protein